MIPYLRYFLLVYSRKATYAGFLSGYIIVRVSYVLCYECRVFNAISRNNVDFYLFNTLFTI